MAFQTRSSVFAIKEEVTEGTLIQPASGADFTVLREGFSMSSELESVGSDELVNDIGASKSFTTKEVPTGSIPKYFKHSGTEGVAPDYALLVKSALGSQTDNTTEYDTIAGSTAGTSTAAGIVKVDTGEGAQFEEGQGLLIKDGTNGYSIRNVNSVSTDDLQLNYNLSSAPGTGVNLGKAIHFAPAATGHVTFSAHLYQAATSNGVTQSMAGCRTVSMGAEFPVNDLATMSFDIAGIEAFRNPIVIDGTNEDIDFTDSSSTEVATLTNKTYKTPKDLASEIATKMSASSVDTISCSFDSTTGKFTISSDGSTLSLLWDTGANTATSVGATIGFSVAADDTGALTYTSDNELSYDAAYTPSFDSSDPLVVKCSELLIGQYYRNDNRSASSFSLTVGTPKTDVEDFTSCTGVSESIVLSRTVTASTTLIFKKHEIDQFDELLNNTTTSCMFNVGQKDNSNNWVPGSCINVYMPNATVSSNVIADSDGIVVVEIELTGFVDTDRKDVHINML